MHLDSENNFTGLTKCPFNLLLSSGGSSSGEGAVVAFGGSAIGVGSDIGGSIRAPAAFSGCHGLRPTTRRISTKGGISSGAGQESVPAVVGPLGRSIDDLELWMKSYINEGQPWNYDAWTIPLPWRDVDVPLVSDLTVAVIRDDGLVRVTPPIRRAIDEVVNKLKAAGANVIEFTPPNTQLAYETVNKMYNCDGNHMQRELLAASGEPLTKLTKWNLNFGDGSEHTKVADNRVLNVTRDQLRDEYNQFFVDNKVDVILSPTYNNVAPASQGV
jgi:amidase